MIVIALATILILAIAYFQVVQGVFSALIMAILSIVCAVLALNTYPALAGAVLYARQGTYADAIALIALFVLPLLVLRLLFDWLIGGNAVFGVWADRIGGGLLGLISGMVIVGMLMIILQMLPFGRSVLGYSPYDDALQRDQHLVPFRPDEFTVGLANLVSRGALAGEGSFEKLHDDLLLECFCARNTAGRHGSIQAAPDALNVRAAYQPTSEQADWLARAANLPADEQAQPTRIVVVQASVDGSAADADDWWRLPGTHFRLVAGPPKKPRKKPAGEAAAIEAGPPDAPPPPPEQTDEGPRSYYPIGYLAPAKGAPKWTLAPAPEKEGQLLQARLFFEKSAGRSRRSATVYWVYRIRETHKPDYLVFRRVASKNVPALKKAAPAPPAAPPPPKEKPKKDKPKTRPKEKPKPRPRRRR